MTRKMNFGAGPGTLPLLALEQACVDLLDLDGSGVGVLEHSHRGKEYEAVHDEAISLVRKLGNLTDEHEVLFLQGGASMQFAQIPLSFVTPQKSAEYVLTGAFGEKAYDEAKRVAKLKGGSARVAVSTKEMRGGRETFVRVPQTIHSDPESVYVHFTSNETIHGVQFSPLPAIEGNVPVVCDMSSDFFSRPVDFSKIDFSYAGAQKNAGPSGLVIVIAKKDFLGRADAEVPKIWDYRVMVENRSLYNTPATFSIYMTRNVLRWLDGLGGTSGIERLNEKKAELIYGAIDRNAELFRGPVEKKSRSRMSVVFELPDAEIEKRFLSGAVERGMVGLKGHRAVGGIRASLYNAVELSSAEALASYMDEFARTVK